jgi:phage shock protein PspC (stress-responsive transcriptional regulator)
LENGEFRNLARFVLSLLHPHPKEQMMQNVQSNLFTRPDTFFGVCEGLGEDLGIHSNFLRVALAGLLFWNPPLAAGVYAGLGVLVGLTRWLVPNPRPVAAQVEATAAEAQPEPLQAEELPLAA